MHQTGREATERAPDGPSRTRQFPVLRKTGLREWVGISVIEKTLPNLERDLRKKQKNKAHSLVTAPPPVCHLEAFLVAQLLPVALAEGSLSSLPQLPLVLTSRARGL